MSNELVSKELQEAIMAGKRAFTSLRLAKEKLDSARNWGIFDLLGGGFFTDVVKHSKLKDASSYVEKAKGDLRIFQRELQDVQQIGEIKIEVGGFLSFADFFFDGLVADYLVQSKISEARRQVDDAIYRVEGLLRQLERTSSYGKRMEE